MRKPQPDISTDMPVRLSARTLFRLWIVTCILALAAIWLSITFLDGPAANFCQRILHLHLSRHVPTSRQALIWLMVCAGAGAGYCLFDRRMAGFSATLLLATAGAIVSAFVNRHLAKPFFGRPMPLTYVYHLRNHFAWHTDLLAKSAFPSTHAALAAAALGIFALRIPQMRGLCCLVLLGINTLLVAGGFHFVSDVIAGDLLGFSLALLCQAVSLFLYQGLRGNLN